MIVLNLGLACLWVKGHSMGQGPSEPKAVFEPWAVKSGLGPSVGQRPFQPKAVFEPQAVSKPYAVFELVSP